MPEYCIKTIRKDGLCIAHAFKESLKSVGKDLETDEIIKSLRNEILENVELYTSFSPSGINVAQHLENFVDEPLKYYAAETTNIFLHALGNAFKSNTVIFQVDDARAWKTDLSDDEKPYDYTLYFARCGNDLNAVVPKTSMNESHDDESHGGESHDEVESGDISAETSKCCTDSDSNLEISKLLQLSLAMELMYQELQQKLRNKIVIQLKKIWKLLQ